MASIAIAYRGLARNRNTIAPSLAFFLMTPYRAQLWRSPLLLGNDIPRRRRACRFGEMRILISTLPRCENRDRGFYRKAHQFPPDGFGPIADGLSPDMIDIAVYFSPFGMMVGVDPPTTHTCEKTPTAFWMSLSRCSSSLSFGIPPFWSIRRQYTSRCSAILGWRRWCPPPPPC